MQKIEFFLKSHHSYVIAAIAFLTAIVQILFGVNIPTFVYDAEVALFGISIRVTTTQITGSVGWKTYVVAALLAALAAARASGMAIPVEIDALVASMFGVTMVSAVKKSV